MTGIAGSFLALAGLYSLSAVISAQTVTSAATNPEPPAQLTWNIDAADGQRFVAAHGERSTLFGYGRQGLEFWAYPLQVFSGYTISFREPGAIAPLNGADLLRRVEYKPDETVRVYIGPDFVVREHLFVPRSEPGAVIAYEVLGRVPVTILAHFIPSMNLMWPAALGGQGASWDPAQQGYKLIQPSDGFTATIASPQTTAHDAVVNRNLALDTGYTLEMKPVADSPEHATAHLFAALDGPADPLPANSWLARISATAAVADAMRITTVAQLEQTLPALEAVSAQHNADVLANSLEIDTPDPELNRSLRWAELALDQAWVCNPQLGCGEVAGYGPSRPGRRPQYDWFFAGDGLVATQALLAAGEYDRARAELAFIARYQNPRNGMIWHELSQSAGLLDWPRSYGYMYVHVDITLQYLATLGDYLRITGDTAFVKAHWSGVQAAYRYASSLVSAATGLPEIPAGQEGEDEQDRLRDELSLSAAWMQASHAYAALARANNEAQAASAADHAGDRAKQAITAQYWDGTKQFWIAGHTENGKPIEDNRMGPGGLLDEDVFSPAQRDAVLDRLTGPSFETDWGARGMSDDSPNYDPNSYGKGSVSLLASSTLATALWRAHRPIAAWELWRGIAAWNTLDSPGHLHEVAAGDLYQPEIESVPEQTWSSAGFLSSAVHGLLGLEIDGAAATATFAPHLPPQWNELTLRHLRVGTATLDLHIARTPDGLTLDVTEQGQATTLNFSPEIPLRATVEGAQVGNQRISATSETHAGDTHATIRLALQPGETHCVLSYRGGLLLSVERETPRTGDPSRAPKVVSLRATGTQYTLDAAVDARTGASFLLTTSTTPTLATPAAGASIARAGTNRFRLTIAPENSARGYVSHRIAITLAQ